MNYPEVEEVDASVSLSLHCKWQMFHCELPGEQESAAVSPCYRRLAIAAPLRSRQKHYPFCFGGNLDELHKIPI